MAANAQITSLLANAEFDRLARLRLNAARRFTNRSRGEHLAAKGGTSTEFCDYRDYTPGDDVRFVDWNIFARTERPYLKQFHQEEELHIAVLIDGSESMRFEGKLELAKKVAAALGSVALRGSEKLSVTFLGSGTPSRLLPCRGRVSMGKFLRFTESLEGGGQTPIDSGVEAFLRRHTGRGAAIVISDFLTGGDLRRAFNLLNSAGLEIFALQILGPGELNPELAGDVRLIDSETDANLDISAAGDLLAIYHEYRAAHTTLLADLCRQRQGKFLGVSSADSLESVVFDSMRRKGWLL